MVGCRVWLRAGLMAVAIVTFFGAVLSTSLLYHSSLVVRGVCCDQLKSKRMMCVGVGLTDDRDVCRGRWVVSNSFTREQFLPLLVLSYVLLASWLVVLVLRRAKVYNFWDLHATVMSRSFLRRVVCDVTSEHPAVVVMTLSVWLTTAASWWKTVDVYHDAQSALAVQDSLWQWARPLCFEPSVDFGPGQVSESTLRYCSSEVLKLTATIHKLQNTARAYSAGVCAVLVVSVAVLLLLPQLESEWHKRTVLNAIRRHVKRALDRYRAQLLWLSATKLHTCEPDCDSESRCPQRVYHTFGTSSMFDPNVVRLVGEFVDF